LQLYMSRNSTYARRARIALRETGLIDRVKEIIVSGFDELATLAPGAKIPVLVTDNGECLTESLIVTRYINDLAGGILLPVDAVALEQDLALEGLASVLMDSLFVRSTENNRREEPFRSPAVLDRERARCARCYDALDRKVVALETVTLGTITTVAALGYANWRGPEDHWDRGRADLAAFYERMMARPAFANTAPVF